ncbi:hypothetical protein [Staphylococcus saprophyticus]|uniref:hypothetical protein n=1 Tax=Staphylococcus saprophyticus TaxID=29385 RepID=UPI000D1DDB11|nr:hypothetical protein [Staphylococcus saprophyticus]PTK09479.1 hypothetical protein BUZ75_12590 [Staphylococcus saprophyticus]
MCKLEEIDNDLVPLKQWYCDHCGEVINDPNDGWLEWHHESGEIGNYEGYRIVHHDKKCMYDASRLFRENKSLSDMHLTSYIGPDGLVSLLSMIEFNDVKDNSELIEIIRRLHIPYYEEARKYHHVANEEGFFDGANELMAYRQNTSKYIINNFKRIDY